MSVISLNRNGVERVEEIELERVLREGDKC